MDIRKARSVIWNGQILFGQEVALYFQRHIVVLTTLDQLAENIGINMHTVNKAYSVLREEGFLQLDRRRGAVIALDIDKIRAMEDMRRYLRVALAKAHCHNITKEDIYELVDEIYEDYK